MAKIVKPLTNTEIAQAKPRAKEYNLTDGDGLILRVKPNGSKLWLFNYYHPYTKKRKNLGLGTYPEISLAQARQSRLDARKLVAANIDPKEHRDTVQKAAEQEQLNTLEKVANDWFLIKKTKVTNDYATSLWRSLENHLFPRLGKYPISKLTATSTIEVLKPIAAKGSLETVRRLCQRLNEIMIYAVNTGVIFSNPLSGISHAFEAPKKQLMATIRPDELPELMQALNTASIKLVTRFLIEWQLHTMVRPNEAAGAKWSEIDFDNKLWTVPPARMKMKREHIVPLSDQVLSLLEALKPISGHREHIFPADRDPKSHANSQTANMALKRMGYGGKLVSHGLRALASTTLNEQGFDPDLIEASLAHVDKNDVRRAYNRADYLERRKPIMAWWSEYIEQAASGSNSLAGGYKGLRVVNQN
ncbi:DUF4102 domain-containing protein [Shewanella maritima]|uniref:DUF4102 domain-containing protein n=1 Tax=Shewanella maritima TaxID=2520507 RepID=A0A411PEP2_9GAMM|nr:integrase domain-containing protein [Shewanella maritima]QBF81958.1 DUF4102 domain-containing protein [Shewanella maritima]